MRTQLYIGTEAGFIDKATGIGEHSIETLPKKLFQMNFNTAIISHEGGIMTKGILGVLGVTDEDIGKMRPGFLKNAVNMLRHMGDGSAVSSDFGKYEFVPPIKSTAILSDISGFIFSIW